MRTALCIVLTTLILSAGFCVQGEEKVPAALRFTMKSLDGKDVNLADYQDKVLLVVNVASECGLTPQY